MYEFCEVQNVVCFKNGNSILRELGYFKSNIVLRNETSTLKLSLMRQTCEQVLIGISTIAFPSGPRQFVPHTRTSRPRGNREGTGEERRKAWKFAGPGRRHRHQNEGHWVRRAENEREGSPSKDLKGTWGQQRRKKVSPISFLGIRDLDFVWFLLLLQWCIAIWSCS